VPALIYQHLEHHVARENAPHPAEAKRAEPVAESRPRGGLGSLGANSSALWGCRLATPTLASPLLTLAYFVLAFPAAAQLRGIHFFFVHRGMHPWFDRKGGLLQGDVGAFLYRWVHSLHHKSHNPGPWSSLSMHPVEHFFYFSGLAIMAVAVPCHPLHLLFVKYHTDISALAGHDGHAHPGAGDVGHYLHHAKFECNYGFSFPNYLDKLFGTYEDGTRWTKAGQGSQKKAR